MLTIETVQLLHQLKILQSYGITITVLKTSKKQLLNNINEFSINETFGGQDAEVDDKFLNFGSNNT